MLEDDFTYVLRKALAGHGLTLAEAAERAGITPHQAGDFMAGRFVPDIARAFAPVLGLNAEAFARHAVYQPPPATVPGIRRLDLPFGDGQVNAWLLRTEGASALFDAGHDPHDLLRALESDGGRMPDRVFITHSHRDHVGALGKFLAAGLPVHSADLPGTIRMKPGDTVLCGPLAVKACDLAGHAVPALGYRIDGLAVPVLVTGDALFAGSIGGCRTPASYRQALCTLRAALAPLPDSTVLLPGHGPGTTLGGERSGNPFL